jgi:hypothetical protein
MQLRDGTALEFAGSQRDDSTKTTFPKKKGTS